jgi:hypothetical protein
MKLDHEQLDVYPVSSGSHAPETAQEFAPIVDPMPRSGTWERQHLAGHGAKRR